MLDSKWLRDNRQICEEGLKSRGQEIDLSLFYELDEKRRLLQQEFDGLRGEQNQVSKQIQKAKKEGLDAVPLMSSMQSVAARLKQIGPEQNKIEEELNHFLLGIPNMPNPSIPVGDESFNRVERSWGEKTNFAFKPKEHWEIGEQLGILDFERAAKIAGSRFAIYKGWGAKLERALINFMLDLHTTEHGYTEMIPTFMVNAKAMMGTGQLPKFEEDLFKLNNGYYLIPTAEVPVTNYFQNEILKEEDLPISFSAQTPCFRAEAGSAGKDTKGLLRQHQFNKVELVKFVHPKESENALERLTKHAETILQKLGLHYQVVTLSTGDLGFSANKTYDLEVWLPGQGAYREISSCSNFDSFQARRANIRFKGKSGKPQFVHTINGSGLAIGRTVIAILEQYQQEDGSIKVPEALHSYVGTKKIS